MLDPMELELHCELPCGCWERNLGPLEAVLPTEPSLPLLEYLCLIMRQGK